jgi:hypothetical protein
MVYQTQTDAGSPEPGSTNNASWLGETGTGRKFDPGTYTYKVEIQSRSAGVLTYTGYVTLIR